jgi:apolipoprotein D and lipocalin family protein
MAAAQFGATQARTCFSAVFYRKFSNLTHLNSIGVPMKLKNKLAMLISAIALTACSNHTPPAGVTPVSPFNASTYSGKWYEIARLDHSFEKGMSHVSAEYFPNADGSVKVINRGFSDAKNTWKEAVGRAKFVGDANTAHLKVSFFGPFYGDYIVFDLDEKYQHALVSGPNHSYLWLLSRQPTMPAEQVQALVAKAKAAGFDVTQLVYVQQGEVLAK